MKVICDSPYPPSRAHDTDAGLDLRAWGGGVVKAHGGLLCRTGVHVELPPGTCGLLVSKSGLMVHHGITSTGLVDESYQGPIMVQLENHSDEDYVVLPGDKISQLVILPCRYEPVELVDSFDVVTDRGSDGFGSSGR